jgi:hypothetical protein
MLKITVTLGNGMKISQMTTIKKVVFEAPPEGVSVPPIEVEFRGGPIRVEAHPFIGRGYAFSMSSDNNPMLFLGGTIPLAELIKLVKQGVPTFAGFGVNDVTDDKQT